MMKAVAIVIALAGAGCLRTTTYKCTGNDMCTGTGGTCELTGFCSFSDADCAEGRRYGDLAGKFSNTCVGDLPLDIDSGVDGPPGDGTTGDVPLGNCPTSYVAVGGQTHRYRVITNAADHVTQKAACDADGTSTYLAVPDDQAELTSILTLAAGDTWVGIDDMVEGTYATANGGTILLDSLLWATGEPDDMPESGGGNAADCVAAFNSDDQLYDDRCANTFPAVCECDP